MKIQNVNIFLFLKKTAPKTDKFLKFLPYIERAAISVSQS